MYSISLFKEYIGDEIYAAFRYTNSPGYILQEKYKDWCKENVGQDNWNYYGINQKTPRQIRFKREEDLLAFRLVFGL